MSKNRIGDELCETVIEGLYDNKTLQTLILRDNNLKDKAANSIKK
jgi:hypothetical protein